MKIKFEELKKAIFGALRINDDNGIIKPRRFTEKQVEYFVKTENYIHKLQKSRASSGIIIDFYTNSEMLILETHCFVASSQTLCYFDIFIDSELKEHIGYNEKEDKNINIDIKIPKGEKRVTVYLPNLFGTDILNFELSDGASFKPAEKGRKIMFFGDSITQGYTAEFPSLTYSNIVSRELNAECINQGIGAAIFNPSDLDENFVFKPDMVFIAYGTNDWFHNRDIEKESDAYFKKIKSIFPDSKIYVITPIWRANYKEKEEKTSVSFAKMHENLEKACKKNEVTIIDGMNLVPHNSDLFRPDGTHPTDDGFKYYGNNLLKKLKEL